jgi:hypothetical protein
MRSAELLVDGFGRVRDGVAELLAQVPDDDLARRPGPGANPVGWLVWHLARVQDDHVSAIADREQVWLAGGWAARAGLPFETGDIGYGHSTEQVGQVRLDAEFLLGYLDAVHDMTVGVLQGLSDDDLDRVVDEAWDPPVTAGVRLVSVLVDDLEHLGQAEYVAGMLRRESTDPG